MTKIKRIHKDTLSCEAIFRIAPDGHYFIVSQCGGPSEPHLENRIYIFHSYNKGRTWSRPSLIVEDNGLSQYQTEVAIVDNEILVFMCEHDGNFCNFHSYVISSTDNGSTFKRKFDLPLLKGFCFIRGMIKVADEYLFPYQHYPISKKENDYLFENKLKIWQGATNIVEMGILRTKDFKDFEISEAPAILKMEWNNKKRWVWSEPTVVNVNEKLIMFLRYDPRGYLFKSESLDNGYTWSEPTQTNIPNPSNKTKAIKWGNKIVLLNTPQNIVGFSHRNPLAIWISEDGENWLYKKNIVKYKGWISYPDGVIKDNTLLFAFEYNRKDIYFVKRKLCKC